MCVHDAHAMYYAPRISVVTAHRRADRIRAAHRLHMLVERGPRALGDFRCRLPRRHARGQRTTTQLAAAPRSRAFAAARAADAAITIVAIVAIVAVAPTLVGREEVVVLAQRSVDAHAYLRAEEGATELRALELRPNEF